MKKKFNILAVVSARGGSKGVPNKNIKKLNNIPLIAYSLKTLTKIKSLDQIIVSSDSDSVVTLKRIEHEHPYRAKEFNIKNKRFKSFIKNINVEKFISRQELPTLYCTSGAVYARTINLLRKFNEKDFNLGKKPIGVIVDDIEAINIDRQIDFDLANLISKKYKS